MSAVGRDRQREFRRGLLPLVGAAAYAIVAAGANATSQVPISVVIFGLLYVATSSGSTFEEYESDGAIDRWATAILGHWVIRAVAVLGVVGLYAALFDVLLA